MKNVLLALLLSLSTVAFAQEGPHRSSAPLAPKAEKKVDTPKGKKKSKKAKKEVVVTPAAPKVDAAKK